MTKPDYRSMLAQSAFNEQALRATIARFDGKSCPLELVIAHNQTVEAILTLQMYLNEQENRDEDSDSSLTSSLGDVIDGEASEKDWEKLIRDNPFLRDMTDPPEGVV